MTVRVQVSPGKGAGGYALDLAQDSKATCSARAQRNVGFFCCLAIRDLIFEMTIGDVLRVNGCPPSLRRGEHARLFPVLATTSKEGRTTSIVLACISKVREFGSTLLEPLGQKTGVWAKLETYTEVVFRTE